MEFNERCVVLKRLCVPAVVLVFALFGGAWSAAANAQHTAGGAESTPAVVQLSSPTGCGEACGWSWW